MKNRYEQPEKLLAEARRLNSGNAAKMITQLRDDSAKASARRLWGLIDTAISDYDDGIYFVYACAMPDLTAKNTIYTGPLAYQIGFVGAGYAFVHAGLGLVSNWLQKKVRDNEREKEITVIEQLIAEVIKQEALLKKEGVYVRRKNNAQLHGGLLDEYNAEMEKEEKDRLLDSYQLEKIKGVLDRVDNTLHPKKKSKVREVLDSIESVTDIFTRVNTGFGIILYPFYYFGWALSFTLKLVAALVGPIIGGARYLARRKANKEAEKEATVVDYKQYYEQRIAMLKRLRKIKKAQAKEAEEKKIIVDLPEDLETKIRSRYTLERKKFNVHKHLDAVSRYQFMITLGLLFGVVPVKIVFWFAGFAVVGLSFALPALIIGGLVAAVYFYKAWKTIQQLKQQVSEKIDSLEELELNRLSRWKNRYGEKVDEKYIENFQAKSELELLKEYLSLVVKANQKDEQVKFQKLVNETMEITADLRDPAFYNRLAYEMRDVKGAKKLIAQLKKQHLNSADKITPEKPGIDLKIGPIKLGRFKSSGLTTATKYIGHFTSVAAPVFMAVYISMVIVAIFSIASGGIAAGIMVGLMGVGLACWGIGKIAQHKREKQLAELTEREHKIKIQDRIVKVSHKYDLQADNNTEKKSAESFGPKVTPEKKVVPAFFEKRNLRRVKSNGKLDHLMRRYKSHATVDALDLAEPKAKEIVNASL